MSGINAGGVYSELVLDTSRFNTGIQNANTQMANVEINLAKIGKTMEKVGKELTTKVTLPIVGVGAAATKLGLDFQAAMSEVGAISGATGEDMVILEQKARDMGATTKFSASDAADALKYMAMAGWETNSMLEGLDGVLALAAASGEDLGMVSDIVTDSMTAFGLQAKEAGHFADVLAKASSSSNTNVGLMGETFKYVAPLAGSLGYSIEDTSLAIGLMANAGIKGSQSGTALRSMITRLIKPTKESGTAMDTLGITMTNTDGSMKSLSEVIEQLREKFVDLNPDQQAFYAAQIAGQEAMSGFLAIVNASDDDFTKLQGNINNATGAAKEMSDMMQDNLKGRWEEFKSGLEEAALQIYDLLLPSLEKLLAKGQAFINWFQGLDEGTKKTILNLAGFAAAIGPVLLISGKLATSISAISGLFTTMSGGAAVAGAAATTAGGGFTLAGAAASASALLFNPWVLGAAAVAGAGYLIYKNLKEEVIPAMEEFDESISESTKNAITNFMDLEKKATTSFNQLAWSGSKVTEEMKNNITSNTNQMADDVIAKLEEQKIEGLKHLGEFLGRSTEMSEEEAKEAIRIATEKYDEEIKKAQDGKKRIEEILEEAKENNRSITEEEKKEIEKILEDLKDNSISLMSESQEEQEKILENLKNNASRLTAEMLLEVVNNSKEQKEKTIKNAEEQYEKVLATAELLKKNGTAESKQLADNMITEAKRQKEETIKQAEEMHEKVVNEIKNQGGDVVKQLDLDNGNIKTKWDELKEWFMRNPIIRKIFTKEEEDKLTPAQSSRLREGVRNRFAHGTNFAPGGLSWVGEQGPELIELPKGSKVHSNQKSMEMMGLDEEKLANAIIKGLKEEGLSKPAVIIMDNKAVGRGIVKVIDSELHTNNSENGIGKGVFT